MIASVAVVDLQVWMIEEDDVVGIDPQIENAEGIPVGHQLGKDIHQIGGPGTGIKVLGKELR